MKYVKHFEKHTISFQDVYKIWSGVIFQSVFFILLFIFLSSINYFKQAFPEFGVYTFHLGLVAIIPSLVLLFYYHRLRRIIKSRFSEITPKFILLGDEARRLKTYMITAIILADIIMLFGVAHLVLTANLLEASYFWLISLFLFMNYKPCVRYINCALNTCSESSDFKEQK